MLLWGQILKFSLLEIAFLKKKIKPEAGQKYISKEKIWINPDCGLKTRGWTEVKKSLKTMVSAAKLLR